LPPAARWNAALLAMMNNQWLRARSVVMSSVRPRASRSQRSPPEMFLIGITTMDGCSARGWMRAPAPPSSHHDSPAMPLTPPAASAAAPRPKRRRDPAGAVATACSTATPSTPAPFVPAPFGPGNTIQ
jgi:hypothetical protein